MTCVRDIIAISGLAIRVYTAYKDTSDDYRHISADVATLQALIEKVAQHFKGTTISSGDHQYGQKVLKGCQAVLEDLMSFIDKYNRLASIHKRLVLNRVKLGKDITALQVRLISETVLLNGFVRSCEYMEVQAQLAALLGLHATAKISVTSIASFAANTNTGTAYKQFCKDLYRIGVTKDMVRLKKAKIWEILRSQGMVGSHQIGGSDIGERDQVLEAAYEEYCKDLYRIGFTDDMILQQKDKILGILRSQGMVTRSSTRKKDNNSSPTKFMPSFMLSSRVNWFESSPEAGSLVPEKYNSAPLHISASHIGIVQQLFSSTKSLVAHRDDTTPLHLASEGGYPGLVELLLCIPSKGHTGVMEKIFSQGASVDTLDRDNNTPLHLAAWKGHTDIVDLLLSKGASIGAIGRYNNTPLHFAARGGHTGIVELLLNQGASVGALRSDGFTPLHVAAYHGHTGVAEQLLEKGAPIGALHPSSSTPLHLAAQEGHTGVVKLLLKKGASIGALRPDRSTPLHLAVDYGHTSVVELLLEKGASIGARNKNGNTPLHVAADIGHTSIVGLLLKKGASIGALNKFSNTPLHLAAEKGHTGILELFFRTGASTEVIGSYGGTLLHSATLGGSTDAVELLLENGASINAIDNDNDTPLHNAVSEGYTGIVKILLEKGASLEVINKKYNTPLRLAAKHGHPEIVQLLVDKAAELAVGGTRG